MEKLSRELSYYIHSRRRAVKHAVAVAIREPVLKAAQSVPIPNGVILTWSTCQNGQEGCEGPYSDELPCLSATRTGPEHHPTTNKKMNNNH